MDDYNTGADAASATLDFTREMLSKFDTSSAVALLDKVALIEPETVLSATCVVLSAASNVASMKFPDMTMYKVLASLERIEGNLKTILEAPLKKAIDTFNFILKAVKSGNFESAYEKLEKLIDNAETAFHYADKNELSIKSYQECAKAIRLLMFGHLLKESYDKGKKVFLTPDQLPAKKVELIGETLEEIARKSIDQKKNVKTTSWGRESGSKKSEAQNILDSILKFAYPYISAAKNLTDMNKQFMIQNSGYLHQFSLLPDLLPDGYEDATQLTLGQLTGSDGRKSVVKVNVWREEESVWSEYKERKTDANIKSESEEVAIKMHLAWITVTAIGEASRWSLSLGVYTLTEEQDRGRPVYRNSGGWHLYSMESGAWAMGYTIGDIHPYYRSTDQAPSPTLCQNWEYYVGKGEYKPGDIKITCSVK